MTKLAYNLYTRSNNNNSTEPNMRQEMIHTLDGEFPEIAKGQPVIIRTPILDSNSQVQFCRCVDKASKEPDRDAFCPYCYCTGYVFKEYQTVGYRVQPFMGPIPSQGIIWYFKYDLSFNFRHDRIIEVTLESDGRIQSPLTRTICWRVKRVIPYRADNGKLEFIKVYGEHEDIRYLNPPDIKHLRYLPNGPINT